MAAPVPLSCLGTAPVLAAPPKEAPSLASEKAQIKPAEEKSVGPTVKEKPKGSVGTQATVESTTAGRPAMRGPRIPEALRAQLEAQLEARVEKDIRNIKKLRTEAIGLLETFVKESPRETREMPEALMRLGELEWENEREAFVMRFAEWENKPVDQRGPAPEHAHAVVDSRQLSCFASGRVVRRRVGEPSYAGFSADRA